jgi:putative oxidoreductase
MKIAIVIARVLLGLIFLIFGLNNFFHFLPMTPVPGDAGVMAGLMFTHGWLIFHGVLYLIAAVLLLVGRYVPVGLTILGPIIVNILVFHITLNMQGIGPGIIVLLLELFLIWAYWPAFRGIFTAKMERYSAS